MEKKLAPLVIWLAPDEKEQTTVTCVPAGPCGVGASPPGDQTSPDEEELTSVYLPAL